MLDFMVVALPRSGTTWAANWLTTDDTICIHDPLYTLHYEDWDKWELPDRKVGVSCTGIWRFKEWLNKHPSRKIVLHRDLDEVNASMVALGLPECTPMDIKALYAVDGWHWGMEDLFDANSACRIYEYLLKKEFDINRHQQLVQIEMQPKFSGLKVGAEVTRRLMDEIKGALT